MSDAVSFDDPEFSKAQLEKLGARIRALRISKGYESHELFANKHEISRSQYGRWERGQNLRFLSLMRLADAFGITVAELLQGL